MLRDVDKHLLSDVGDLLLAIGAVGLLCVTGGIVGETFTAELKGGLVVGS